MLQEPFRKIKSLRLCSEKDQILRSARTLLFLGMFTVIIINFTMEFLKLLTWFFRVHILLKINLTDFNQIVYNVTLKTVSR